MINLALKTVLHARRRFLPVVMAVGISGLMIVAQLSMALGAFELSAKPISQSSADLWVGAKDSRSIEQSNGLSPYAASPLWLDPEVERIEPWHEGASVIIGDADVSTGFAQVQPIDTSSDALAYAQLMPAQMRKALREPMTAVVGGADAARLDIQPGSTLKLGGQDLRIVGTLEGLGALFGVRMLASAATVRALEPSGADRSPPFYLIKVRQGAIPEKVALRLTLLQDNPEYRVWLPLDLADATMVNWVTSSGMGIMILGLSGIALVVTLLVVSQTLGAAIAGSIQEFAALRAYGISFRSIQRVVLRQGVYISVAALAVTALASAGLIALLRAWDVSASMPLPLGIAIMVLLFSVVTVSNLLAVRRLRRADPASLLR